MPVYSYHAKALGGKVIKGEMESTSVVEVRVKLRSQHLIPMKIAEKNVNRMVRVKPTTIGRVKPKDLQIFTRQFATLINSGIPIVQGLQILGNATGSVNLKAALAQIRADVEAGKRLAEAMGVHTQIFDTLYINLVKAGEEAGVLDTILNRLAVYIEKSNKLASKIKGAMFYPAAILGVSVLVVAAIMIFVIPKFEELFKGSGQELPALTVMVINLSHNVVDYWYMYIGGIFGTVTGIRAYYRSPNGRKVMDAYLIRVPLVGTLIQKSAIARFSQTLSTMISSGVSMLEGLEISSKVVGNYVLEVTVLAAKSVVQEGKSMVSAFSKNKYFPDMVVQMMGVGEQTGALDVMLGKVADFYEEEVDYAVTAMTSMMEPLMMVFLGGIIAVLVIAMYLPIFNLANTTG